MMKLMTASIEAFFVAKPAFLEKLDKVVNTLSVQFPKHLNEAMVNVKQLFQQFMLLADKFPWLIPSLSALFIFLVLSWLYSLSKLDHFVYLPQRRHFRLPRYLRKLRFRFGRGKRFKFF